MAAPPLSFPKQESKLMHLFIIHVRFRLKPIFPARMFEVIVEAVLSVDTYISNNRQEY